MNDSRRVIDLHMNLDGRPVSSETTWIPAGPYALVIATVLPDRGLAFELTSTVIGEDGVATHITHLTLGPPGHDPAIRTDEHDRERLDPQIKVRECVHEHIRVALEQLTKLGYDVAIDMPDDAFDELERVES